MKRSIFTISALAVVLLAGVASADSRSLTVPNLPVQQQAPGMPHDVRMQIDRLNQAMHDDAMIPGRNSPQIGLSGGGGGGAINHRGQLSDEQIRKLREQRRNQAASSNRPSHNHGSRVGEPISATRTDAHNRAAAQAALNKFTGHSNVVRNSRGELELRDSDRAANNQPALNNGRSQLSEAERRQRAQTAIDRFRGRSNVQRNNTRSVERLDRRRGSGYSPRRYQQVQRF